MSPALVVLLPMAGALLVGLAALGAQLVRERVVQRRRVRTIAAEVDQVTRHRSSR